MLALTPNTTVKTTAGNCKTAVTQIGSNLPQNSNVLSATGFDSVAVLAYACCSDVKSGAFGVNFSSTIASQAAAIATAGQTILNPLVGGMALSGPVASQVNGAFANLVTQNAAISGETTQEVFISACMAALTYGSVMKGM
jgi:hypothetical protein